MADSLKNLLDKVADDTSRIRLLNLLGWEVRETAPKISIDYCNQSLRLIEKLQKQKNTEYMIEWLELATSNAYNNFGILNNIVYSDKEAAINYHLKALKLREKLAGSSFEQMRKAGRRGMGDSYKNIGSLYISLDEAKSFNYTLKAIELLEETGDKRGVSMCIGNIGSLYQTKGEYDSATHYFEKALVIAKSINNKRSICILLSQIGSSLLIKSDTCTNQKDIKKLTDQALVYFKESLPVATEIHNKLFILRNINCMGAVYKKQQLYEKAIEYFNKSLEMAREINAQEEIIDIYRQLSEVQVSLGNYKKAYELYYIFTEKKDSMSNYVSSSKVVQLQNKYETEKKEKEEEILKKLRETEAKAELDKQKQTRNSFVAGFILVLIFSLIITNRLLLVRKQKKTIEEQKQLVEEKQKEILDSIRYAKRIQKSLLPHEKYIERVLRRAL